MEAVLPSWNEYLDVFAYPPCWLAGLLAGLLSRRWFLAVAAACVLAPLGDLLLAAAFSDAQPRLHWIDSLLFGAAGGLIALCVWALARSVRTARRRPRQG